MHSGYFLSIPALYHPIPHLVLSTFMIFGIVYDPVSLTREVCVSIGAQWDH